MIVVRVTVKTANDLEKLLWREGLHNFKAIRKELNHNARFEQYLEDKFGVRPIDITDVNDFFWFDDDTIRKDLGLHCEGEDEDLDEETNNHNKRTHRNLRESARRLHESDRRVPSHLRRFI